LGTELNRIECRGFVNTAMNLSFSIKAGNGLLDGANINISRKTFTTNNAFTALYCLKGVWLWAGMVIVSVNETLIMYPVTFLTFQRFKRSEL
jgi:hypothetical protein